MASTDATKNPDPFAFHFEEIRIGGSGSTGDVNVTGNVGEIELYENINELAIHGTMTMIDNDGIVARLDIQGAEYVKVRAIIPDSPGFPFVKRFRIAKILNTSKASDNVEAYTFQIVDEDSYVNTLQNVSRAYTGDISQIIENILIDYFPDKPQNPLMVGPKPVQKVLKYVVPNITPYQAIKVLKNRATGPAGTPFYAFSTLADSKIRFFDLKELLDYEIINDYQSYIFSVAHTNLIDTMAQNRSYAISRFELRETEDMLSLINNGDIGANYEYINTTGGYVDEYHHDAAVMFENVWQKTKTQKSLAPIFDPVANVGKKFLSDYRSINISQVAASNIFDDVPSLNEDLTDVIHRSKSVGKALRNFLRKSSVHIEVPGRNFFPFNKEYSMTISNKIDIQVLANRDIKKDDDIEDILDQKKSGRYIILASRHSFNAVSKKYTCTLKLGKLGNVRGNTRINRVGYGMGQIDPALARAAGMEF